MVYDEGLRSYKAIAFIKSNPNLVTLKTKSYLLLGVILQKANLSKQKTFRNFSKKLGENYG
jgi:phage terminase large subunit-like protein